MSTPLLTGVTKSKMLVAGRTVTASVIVCGEPAIALFGFEASGHRTQSGAFLHRELT